MRTNNRLGGISSAVLLYFPPRIPPFGLKEPACIDGYIAERPVRTLYSSGFSYRGIRILFYVIQSLLRCDPRRLVTPNGFRSMRIEVDLPIVVHGRVCPKLPLRQPF